MMDTLVSAAWLKTQIDKDDIVLLDCTVDAVSDAPGYVSGITAYLDGHIPNAGFADLMGALKSPTSEMLFALPDVATFCAELRRLGISQTTRVVLYDRSFTGWAARVWWMLRWVGHDKAAILNGGQKAWVAAGHTLAKGPVVRSAGTITPQVRSDVIATRDEIIAGIESDDVALIDTLSPDSYNGVDCGYPRAGHITGASNRFTLDLFDKDGLFKSDAELAAMNAGDMKARHITYCGAGILASASAFALTRLGYGDVAVYVASLQEWASDANLPMTT